MAVKILAADDSVTMQKVLEMTFAGEAVDIETVGGGEAAVERAMQNPPDLVIADASMPMDGYEVARALKSNPATANVGVLLLASQHTPYDPTRGKAAGVDDHILKPYDSQALIDKAKKVLSKPRAAVGTPVSGGPQAIAPRPPAPPRPPPSPPNPAGVSRPASAPASPRSTVAFGTMQPSKPGGERPVLQLAEDDTMTAAAVKPAAVPMPSAPRPVAPKPAVAAQPLRPAAGNGQADPAAPSGPPTPAESTPVAPKPMAKAGGSGSVTPARAASTATAAGSELAEKLAGLGLTQEQVEGVLSLSRDVIERVVWEVVPDLAEVIIREEIRRLTSD